jgi:hypothetical protein
MSLLAQQAQSKSAAKTCSSWVITATVARNLLIPPRQTRANAHSLDSLFDFGVHRNRRLNAQIADQRPFHPPQAPTPFTSPEISDLPSRLRRAGRRWYVAA